MTTDRWSLSTRQVNVWLAVLIVALVATGVMSWGIGTEWVRVWTTAHAVCGFAVLALLPAKARGSVRAGLRRHRWSRWVSVVMGVAILATIVLGIAHSWGIWFGVGYWSALWTHTLLAFVVLPLVMWHALARRAPVRRVDVSRRTLLAVGVRLGAGAAVLGAAEAVTRTVGRGDRGASGSREYASFDPAAMPAVSWIDDVAPDDVDVASWPLSIAGSPVDVASLRERATEVDADLDCTGGWWSRQTWQVVPVAELLDVRGARSIVVTSATGFRRAFPASDAEHVYLAVGYGGEPLRRRHGAPVRIVAPGRRGPWWVKWVVSVETSDRPWWWQAPFPTT